jgi:tetratricopeptide (TPR) repeat protein
MFELKLLSREGIPGALEKAERYRLLNQPSEAESIYRDVLEVAPDNQEAVRGLLLAVTDQFDHGAPGSVIRAREVLPLIRNEYERAYYAGIICERRAKVILHEGRTGSGPMAFELLREAKAWYEKAEALRPPGNDDVLLRWNACARLLMRNPHVVAASTESYEPYSDS